MPKVMKSWREAISEMTHNKLIKPAQEVVKFGTTQTICLGKYTVRMTVENAKFITSSPFVILGAILAFIVGEYLPLHQTTGQWTKQVIWNTLQRMAFQEPEVDIWKDLIFKAKNAMVGAGGGLLTHVVLDQLNKAIYGIGLEARQQYQIPDGNVVQDFLKLGGQASVLAAKGATYGALTYVQQRAHKKREKAILDHYQKLQSQIPMLALQAQQPAITYPYPYPFTQAMLPAPPQTAPKKTKPSYVVSDEVQYNPDLEDDDDEAENAMVTTKPKRKATAKLKKGRGFADERTQIGSAPHLPYNDLSNDSFLVKPRTAEPVV